MGVFFYLWIADERRSLARSFALSIALCVMLTVAGKLVFHLVRWHEETSLRLLSPSGHVAIGTAFYGCCAIMLAGRSGRAVRRSVAVGTAVLLGMLAGSRVIPGLHSVPEIVVAFAIGGVSLLAFARASAKHRQVPLDAAPLVWLVLLLFVAHLAARVDGESLRSEERPVGTHGVSTGDSRWAPYPA